MSIREGFKAANISIFHLVVCEIVLIILIILLISVFEINLSQLLGDFRASILDFNNAITISFILAVVISDKIKLNNLQLNRIARDAFIFMTVNSIILVIISQISLFLNIFIGVSLILLFINILELYLICKVVLKIF